MFAERTNWNLSPNRLSEALAECRASGKPLLDLTVSNPTECGFRYDQEAIFAALSDPRALSYEPDPKGLERARIAVAAYYAERDARVSANEVILTSSTSEAYSYVFRMLCNPGDELLIAQPSYPLFDFLADIQDVKLARYPLIYDHGWQIDFPLLENAITRRAKGIIVVNPNNPTGQFLKPRDIQKLNQLCNARGMALIADEVFLDFDLAQTKAYSLAANDSALTFTMSGLSKISGLPQMKASWLVVSGPEELRRDALARLEVIADTFLPVSTPIQIALPALLRMRRDFQSQLVTRARQNLAELDRQLVLQKTCTRLFVEGGWCAVLRVPATRSDEDLAIDLLTKHGVHVHPGHFYDFPTDGYLVVSLITRQVDFREGIKCVLSSFDVSSNSA
jgi:aspartate/methionine/tyrosine aminotransferase